MRALIVAVLEATAVNEFKLAAAKWNATNGDGMTGKDLELARAWFQVRKDGRQVRRVNEVLRMRIASVFRKQTGRG